MAKLTEAIIHFLHSQNFAILTTIDRKGLPHSSCKGIVEIKPSGYIYFLDLYRKDTYSNLKLNPRISITVVDEHRFRGYCLKGKARITSINKLDTKIIKAWDARIASRITQRVIKNIVGEKSHLHHPEALLPKPQYLIVVKVEEIVDLAPYHLTGGMNHG